MSAIDRLRRLDPARADMLLAAVLLALAQVEIWLTPAVADRRTETAVAAAAMTIPLGWRRRVPLAATIGALCGVTALAVTTGLPNVAFLLPVGLVAMYSLGAYAGSERAVVGLALALVALPLGAIRTDDPTITDLTAPVVLFVVAWAGGRAIRARRHRDDELEDRNAALVRDQAVRERQAAAEERRRIARELHDIVAHRVTTIVIQAESGSATAHDAGRAREAFGAIAQSGRQSLDELRRLLGLLREDAESPATDPQPGLARLSELLADVRGAGLEVDALIEGDLEGLTAGVDLTVYRIVQEALTNAMRHSRTRATVHVRRDAGRVVVDVRNRLIHGAPLNGYGPGRGLAGMRERVRVYDGELTAGVDGNDWVVRVSLPLRGADR